MHMDMMNLSKYMTFLMIWGIIFNTLNDYYYFPNFISH